MWLEKQENHGDACEDNEKHVYREGEALICCTGDIKVAKELV